MIGRRPIYIVCSIVLALAFSLAPLLRAIPAAAIPAGTRFLVELRDKLDATRVKPGKKFDARTLETLQASDGSLIPAGTKLKGRVTHVEHNKMAFPFERIETPYGKLPIVATVLGVVGEKGVKRNADEEGEIKAEGERGRDAAIGAAVGGGIGAGVGAAKGGGKGAAIGAGAGAVAGAIFGAAAGGRDLVLHEGTRIEVQLDRPLVLTPSR